MTDGEKPEELPSLSAEPTGLFFESDDPNSEKHTALMSNIHRLETDLDTEKEERKEERFYWVGLAALLLDAIIIQAIDGSWLFVLLFILEVILLLGLAQRWGVGWAVKSLGWFLHWISEDFRGFQKKLN